MSGRVLTSLDLHLTTLETTVLERLSRSRVTLSAVAFAADWDEDSQREQAVPVTYDLVHWLLNMLNERGLIVFRLGEHDIPTYIRVTDDGYNAIGYTTRHSVVNVRRSYRGEASAHPGDKTDFRNVRPYSADGCGPVEHTTLDLHLLDYPEHRATKGGF